MYDLNCVPNFKKYFLTFRQWRLIDEIGDNLCFLQYCIVIERIPNTEKFTAFRVVSLETWVYLH